MQSTAERPAAAALALGAQPEQDTILARKWSPEVISLGYTAVPDILLTHMGSLGLSPTELVLLLQLLRYWWTFEKLPFPSKRKLAQAIGCSEKNVQKVMKGLEERGFVLRLQRRRDCDCNRSESNLYSLDPLVAKLRALAPEEVRKRQLVMRLRGGSSAPD